MRSPSTLTLSSIDTAVHATAAAAKEPLKIGALVVRIASPHDTIVKDGLIGSVVQVLPASDGEYGYFVRFEDGAQPVFCAGSRLRPTNGVASLATSEHISTTVAPKSSVQ